MRPDRTDPAASRTSSFALSGAELRQFVDGGVDAVADLVATTYGPRGMEKLVEFEGEKNAVVAEVLRSGAGVLDAVDRGGGFTHPVAAVLVDAVDTMHRDLHDGSTTAVLLTRALLDRGAELVDAGLSPTDVLVGYAVAADEVGRVLDGLARPVAHDDTETLDAVARTMLATRLDGAPDERVVRLVVDAVTRLAAESDGAWVDTKQVKVLAAPTVDTARHDGVVVTRWPKGAETSDRSLVDFDWNPQFPESRRDLTVAIVDAELDVEDAATNFGAGADRGVSLDSAAAVTRYRAGVEDAQERLAREIADLGVDVLVSQVRVDDDLTERFEAAGVAVVDRVETPERDVDRLAAATGATVVSRPGELTPDRLGSVGRLSDRRVGDEKWTFFTGCAGPATTLTLRAPTERAATVRRRAVEDAIEVVATAVMDGQVLPGAGAPAATAAAALRDAAAGVGGREALAVAAFGAALEDSVRTLARNGGLDPIDAVTGLRTARFEGRVEGDGTAGGTENGGDAVGIDVVAGERVDAWAAGVVEPRRTFSQALETARSTAVQLLTTDAFLHPNVGLTEVAPNTEHD